MTSRAKLGSISGKQHSIVGKLTVADLLKALQQVADLQVLLFLAAHIVDDVTLVHHDQAVAVLDGILHVVGDHQGGQVVFLDDLLGQRQHLGRGLGVKGGGVLVQQQELGLFEGRHQQRDSLALTAGEQADLAGHTVFQPQIQRFEQLVVFVVLLLRDADLQRAGQAAAGRQREIFIDLHGSRRAHHRVLKHTAQKFGAFVLRQFAIRGYVLDRKRMENGSFIGEDYFEHLLAEIREIRLSERRFYQKLTDIYATAIDYNKDAPTTHLFFKKVQNKMHYAVHGHTAAELIVERADANKEHMGLTTWENAPNGKIVKTDVSVAKNYLREKELEEMGRIVNASLDMAESMAMRHIPMTMEDWAKRIDKFINLFESPILQDSGKVSAEYAKEFAESEFEKYRIIQDRLFQSDFDRFEDNSLPALDIE